MININFYWLFNKLKQNYTDFIRGKNTETKKIKSVNQENCEYENKILNKFLSNAFITPETQICLEPHIKQIQNELFFHSIYGINPWLNLTSSWYFNKCKYLFYKFIKPTKNTYENIKPKKYLRNNKMNTNIDNIFFNRKEYKKLLEDPNNFLELKWKSNILIENTPRGNIIMYYDAYKEAFAYYSDQTGIPYKILNIVAMKYVMKFFCIDFFVDETVLFGKNPSPFIDIILEDQNKENEKKKQNMKNLLGISLDNNCKDHIIPFVKPKNTNKTQNKNDLTSQITENPKMKNKFIYIGKITNFSIIQKIPKNKKIAITGFTSEYDELFGLHAQTQKNCMDYKSFKSIIQKKNEDIQNTSFSDDYFLG